MINSQFQQLSLSKSITVSKNLKISVVTPSFNQGIFLEETIKSVLSQNYPNLEYVVIDGGSTDNSVDIIKKYQSHLHYWCSKPDKGHADAINRGFSHTSGEIMAWINSDDKYLPWTFTIVNKIFRQFPQVNWLVGFNSWWNDEGVLINAEKRPKNIYDFLLGNYGWIQQESVFWRRSLWEKAGGYINQDMKLMVDGELWCRFFLLDELYSIDCILGGYRLHSTNRAKDNLANCMAEMAKAIEIMKASCSAEVIKNYQFLRYLQPINNLPVIRYLPVNKVMAQIFPRIYQAAAYKNIYYEDGKWQQRFLDFAC